MVIKDLLKQVKTMTDEYILEKGYKQYSSTYYDNKYIVAKFQKRFDDEYGKKYFINILKWSNSFVPVDRRNEYWQPYNYEYDVQVSMYEEKNTINLRFYADWTLDRVEEFMADFFEKMCPNYYELDEQRGVRPYAKS